MNRVPNEQLYDLHIRLLENPARFFIDEWPGIDWPRFDTRADDAQFEWIPVWDWTDTLIEWAEQWGKPRLALLEDDLYQTAQHSWGASRPDTFMVIEIGKASILQMMNPRLVPGLEHLPTNPPQSVKAIAEPFAARWAVTDGDELAAAALSAVFGQTEVTAFPLATGPDFPYRLTGEVAYHVDGDPRNPDLQIFMKHVDEWAAMCAGIPIRRAGGQLATFATLRDMREAYARYRDSLPEGTRPKQWKFAQAYGLTDSAIRKRLAAIGATWNDVIRGN